jgi:Rrf2 family iron-sulfur cluster assembly transcriptional regulator
MARAVQALAGARNRSDIRILIFLDQFGDFLLAGRLFWSYKYVIGSIVWGWKKTMLSQTGEYALRAIVHIAQQDADRTVGAKEIAEARNIPPNYLSKILRELVRAGLLDSARGVGGGFRIARQLGEIRVADIVGPFDDVSRQTQCPLGQTDCDGQDRCPIDANWRPVAEAFHNFVQKTTLQDFVNNESCRDADLCSQEQ